MFIVILDLPYYGINNNLSMYQMPCRHDNKFFKNSTCQSIYKYPSEYGIRNHFIQYMILQ